MNRDGEFFKFPPTTSYATSKVAHTYTRTCTRWLYANESIEIALDCVTGESGRVYIYIYIIAFVESIFLFEQAGYDDIFRGKDLA